MLRSEAQASDEVVIVTDPSATSSDAIVLESSPLRLVLVLGPVYGLLGLALDASWRLRSAPAVLGVALMATTLAGLMCISFSTLKAVGGGMRLELQRGMPTKRTGKEIGRQRHSKLEHE